MPTIVLSGAFLLLAACQGPSWRETPEPALEIKPGVAFERDITRAGSIDTYRIHLDQGEYAHLVVDQQGADVTCKLTGPDNSVLLTVDDMAAAWGPEDLYWVARQAGHFQLVVETVRVEGPSRYKIAVETVKSAQPEHRQKALAARLFDTAERLRESGTKSYPEAATRYEEAATIWRGLGDQDNEAEALHRLGFMRRREHDWRQAIQYFEQAGPLFKAAGNVRMHSAALQQIGSSYYFLGEVESALLVYDEALQLRNKLGDPRWQAGTLNNIGIANVLIGEFQQALTAYDEALVRMREVGDRSKEAETILNRGKCYLYLGQFQQALDDLNSALLTYDELDDLKGQRTALTGLGLVYEALARFANSTDSVDLNTENLGRALDSLERALEISITINDRPGQAVTLSSLGRVYNSLQDADASLNAFTQAKEIFHALGDQNRASFVRYQIGTLLFSLDKIEEALAYFRQALPFLEATGRQHTVDAWAKIALAEYQRGHFEDALTAIEQALDRTETLRIKPASHELRSSFFALRQDYYGSYIEILMALHQRSPQAAHHATALAASERARARSQLEALIESGADIRRGADPGLLARERLLEKEINRKELQRMRLLDEEMIVPQTDRVFAIEKELRTLLREYEQTRARIRLSSPTYTALTQPRPLDAKGIQQALDENSLLLQYKLGDKHSYLWAVTHDSISSFELPGRSELDRLARRVYDLLVVSHRRESRMPTQNALDKLSDILIGPAAHLMAGQRLLIVSEGALQYIPFAALSDLENLPLVATHEITYVPSVSTLLEIRRRLAHRPRAPGKIAVVADPVFQQYDPRILPGASRAVAASSRDSMDLRRFERLVFSEQEARVILDLAPPDTSFQALGFAANLDTVTGGELSRYQIVHFATHGYVDSEQPALSRLVLSLVDENSQSRPGFLFAHEIYNLEMPAELVVLSACRTALGKEILGEGLIGLTQAFTYAGAARVLVSLWPVNDQATAELMARFYRHLLSEDMAPASALRLAQLSISNERRWKAPYYWAGFVLQGDW